MNPVVRALLVSDIVDSTALVAARGDVEAAEILALHDRIVRDSVARHGGREIDRTDGFLILFERPLDAVECAFELHGGLGAAPLRGNTVRARVGVHLGEVVLRVNEPSDVARGAKPIEAEGLAKSITARICSLATGGQTLVSRAVSDVARRTVTPFVWDDLGAWDLKGVPQPVEILEVAARAEALRGMPAEGDKARRASHRGTLPRPPSSFVGRHGSIERLTALAAAAHLVTLTGPAGSGKTRLALEVAQRLQGGLGGGAWMCNLVEARDTWGICAGVARGMHVPLVEADAIVQLGRAIAARGRTLVVLDNFEQVVNHADETVARWLEMAPDATFFVTSRERLRLPAEEVFEVDPLEVTASGSGTTEAEELFVARARAARPSFRVDPSNADQVREIVRRLEGLPLAVELAAARIAVLSPAQILERLDRPLDLLTRGQRGGPTRQATLRASIESSWDLLSPAERSAFAQCSVFRGGWTLEAAERVLDVSTWPDAGSVLDVVQNLVDKSLVRVVPDPDGAYRYTMLDALTAFARERLDAAPEVAEATRHRHASYFAQAAGTAEADNLASAVDHAGAQGDTSLAIDALMAWVDATLVTGPVGAIRDRLDEALARASDLDKPRLWWARTRVDNLTDEPHQAIEDAVAGMSALGVPFHHHRSAGPVDRRDPALVSRLGREYLDAAVRTGLIAAHRVRAFRTDWADRGDEGERAAWDLLQAEASLLGADVDEALTLLEPWTRPDVAAPVRGKALRTLAVRHLRGRLLEDADDAAQRALEVEVGRGDSEGGLASRLTRARIAAERGDLGFADRELAAVAQRAAELGLVRAEASAQVCRAQVLLWRGDLHAALDLAESGMRRAADPQVRAEAALQRALVARRRRDPNAGALRRSARSYLPDNHAVDVRLLWRFRLADLHEAIDEGHQQLAMSAGAANGTKETLSSWPDRATRGLARALLARGVARVLPFELADGVLRWSVGGRPQQLELSDGVDLLGAHDRALASAEIAEVYARAGDVDRAAKELADATAAAQRMDLRPEAELHRRLGEVRALLDATPRDTG